MPAAQAPRARGARAGAPVLVPALAMALAGLASLLGVWRSLANLNLAGPVTDVVHEPAAPPVTPPRRVLMVLIDGLRADVAWQLPFLGRLAAAGARADLWVDPPSYSSAQYVTFLTGVPPRDSGVRTNVRFAPVALDNVPRRLAAAGRAAREIGDEVDWWQRLFGADFAATRVVAPDGLLAAAAPVAAASDLLLVHLCGVDRVGHRRGAASVEYRQAALEQDRKLEKLATVFGWPAVPVVVLSDHGHTPRGGHGGDDADARHAFLVVSGAGARPGAGGAGAVGAPVQALSVDVAPTLAALLGVAAPANAQGRALVEMLDLDPAARGLLAAADAARIQRATRAAADGRRRAESGAAWPRIARAVALLAAALLLAGALRGRGSHVRAGVPGGLAALVAGAGAYFAYHHRVSFSADRDVPALAVTTAAIGTVAAAIALAPAVSRAWRGTLATADVCARCLGTVAGGAPVAALAFVAVGVAARRIACEPAWVAAGPLVAYALFTPLALLGAVAPLVPALRGAVRSAPRGHG